MPLGGEASCSQSILSVEDCAGGVHARARAELACTTTLCEAESTAPWTPDAGGQYSRPRAESTSQYATARHSIARATWQQARLSGGAAPAAMAARTRAQHLHSSARGPRQDLAVGLPRSVQRNHSRTNVRGGAVPGRDGGRAGARHHDGIERHIAAVPPRSAEA